MLSGKERQLTRQLEGVLSRISGKEINILFFDLDDRHTCGTIQFDYQIKKEENNGKDDEK